MLASRLALAVVGGRAAVVSVRCGPELVLLLGLHPPVLEPDLDLPLRQPQVVGNLDSEIKFDIYIMDYAIRSGERN